MRGAKEVKQTKMKGQARMDFLSHRSGWSWAEWSEWCKVNDYGIEINDGNIVGFHREEVVYTL